MPNLNDANTRTALMAVGATVASALVLGYLWDRYQASREDQDEWFSRRRTSGVTKVKPNSFAAAPIDDLKKKVASSAAAKPLVSDVKEKASISESITKKETLSVQKAAPVVENQKIVVTETKKEVKHPEQEHYIIEAEGNTKVREREAVVQEVVHPVEVEEIQQVIHRERKKTEVHQIIQPIYEKKMLPAQNQERELIPEHKATEYESREQYIEAFEKGLETPSVEFEEAKKMTLLKAPIVEEVVKTDIIEVIQPVIHRDTIQPTVIHTKQPVFEKVKEQPTLVREVREPIFLTDTEINQLTAATLNLADVAKEEEITTTTTTTLEINKTTEVTKEEKLVETTNPRASVESIVSK